MVGVMAAGYALGPILTREPAARRKWLLTAGFGLTALFILVRFTNLWRPESVVGPGERHLPHLFSFIHCQEISAVALLLLMTLGRR